MRSNSKKLGSKLVLADKEVKDMETKKTKTNTHDTIKIKLLQKKLDIIKLNNLNKN